MTILQQNFILRTTLTSPFGFKVRMAADILGLSKRITLLSADLLDETDTLRQQNPLGRIPCLVMPDGTGVYDSVVIVDFLQELSGIDRLLPRSGWTRTRKFTLGRLADGIVEAGGLIIYEGRWHEPGAQSDGWLSHQRGKIKRALAAFEDSPPDHRTSDLVAICLACALEFLDRRKAISWRSSCPRLVSWYAAFVDHEPAFNRTKPPAA